MATRGLVRGMGRVAGWAARAGYALTTRSPGAPVDRPRVLDAPAGTVLRSRMATLLAESAELDHGTALDRLYARVLSSLAPDEARVLATLSEGSPFPTVDVVERTPLGRISRPVLRHVSTVGEAAGVLLTDHVPCYLARLVDLGLVEIGPEDRALSTEYDVLSADDAVSAAVRRVRRATLTRHTVRLSEFGERFWSACDPAARVVLEGERRDRGPGTASRERRPLPSVPARG